MNYIHGVVHDELRQTLENCHVRVPMYVSPSTVYLTTENVAAMKAIIRKGDSTDHGGTVLDGFAHANLDGRPAAGMGHMVSCPKCNGNFAIVQGSSQYAIDGHAVALDGMKTACGASLIASQQGFLASE